MNIERGDSDREANEDRPMTMILRRHAREASSPIEFIRNFQKTRNHTAGTGVRELARLWYRVRA